MFNPPVVTVTNRQRQCTICRRNKIYKYNKIQIQLLFLKRVQQLNREPLRCTSIVQMQPQGQSRAAVDLVWGQKACSARLFKWMEVCSKPATTQGRHLTVGVKWRQRLAFGEVGSFGCQITELMYSLNLNVTVRLCPQAHTAMMSVEYLHRWRFSAGVSQRDHLSTQQSECFWWSAAKCQQGQSHHRRHIFHPLKCVYVCISVMWSTFFWFYN